MSLVNDMLRDLDERRRDSEGPATKVKLTPAGDNPKRSRKLLFSGTVLVLILIAGGAGYFWLQMNDGAMTRQLDIAVAPRAPVSAGIVEERSEPQPFQEQATRPPVADPSPLNTTLNATATEANVSVTSTASLPVQAAPNTAIAPALETAVQQTPPATPRPATEVAQGTAVQASPPALEFPSEASAPPLGIAALPSAPSVPAPEPEEELVEVVDLTNIFSGTSPLLPDSVKAASASTPEERDTLAVQEALRLIAVSQKPEAFATLEQQLTDNQRAHLSRETYAKLLMNQGDNQLALNLVEQGLQLAPNHSGFKKVKARLLITAGDIESAVTLLMSRAPQVNTDLEYHEILASAQLASRDYRGAALSYTSLVQQDQSQGRWWYGFGASQEALGNEISARQAFVRALEKPNLSTNLRRRAQDRLNRLGQ